MADESWWALLMRLWNDYAYLSQSTAATLQLAVVGFGGVLLLSLWMRWQQSRGMPLWQPAGATALVVTMFYFTSALQGSFNGDPDTRCHQYAGGKLQFELLSPPVLLAPASNDVHDDTTLLLIVRAPAWWGDAFRVCAVPAHSAQARGLLESFAALPDLDIGGASGAMISFTFGNGIEQPNVTWEEYQPPPEKGPPDDPGDDA
jgi:hypothetical protein